MVLASASQNDPAFSPAVYSARADGGRLLVTIQTTLGADTAGWSALPVGNLAIIDAQLDGAPALLQSHGETSEVWAEAGRHALVITASSELERTAVGRAGKWTPALSGKLSAAGIRVEGARAYGQQLAVAAESEIRFVVAGEDIAVDGKGTWLANVTGEFQIGRGTVEATIKIDLDAVGAAPDRIILRLPEGLVPTNIEGDAQEISTSGSEVSLRPLRDHGSAIVHAEGRFSGEEFSLGGLEVIGAGRGEVRLEIISAEGTEVSADVHDGVAAEGTLWRVTKRPYLLTAKTQAVGGVESRKAIVDHASISTTLLPDGQRFAQIDLAIAGKPGRLLAMRLPEGAEIQSVKVGENTVAPTRAGDSLLISLAEIEEGGMVRLVYRTKSDPFHLATFHREALPQFGLDIRASDWNLHVPEGTALLTISGPWENIDPRMSFLTILDSITNGVVFLLSLPKFIWANWATGIVLLFSVLAVFALIRLSLRIKAGILSEPRRDSVVDLMVTNVIAVEEKKGVMARMLLRIADDYEKQVEEAVKALTSLMEPALIVFMGVTIGFLVLSLFMPLFDMSSHVKDGAAPSSIAFKEQAPEHISGERRRGNVSIEVQIPLEGTLYQFRQTGDSKETAGFFLMGSWAWRSIIVALVSIVGLIAFRSRASLPKAFIGVVLADAIIPWALFAGIFGGILGISIDRARARWQA